MHPFTDIIVLVHNALPVTRGFLDRLFKHTTNFRLIIVDNGSDKETADFLKSETEKWTLIRLEENTGVICGRNIGATNVTADYFVNIDNDQYPGEGWLQKLHNLMSTGYDIVGCEAWWMLPPDSKGVVTIGQKNYKRAYYPQKRCTNIKEKFTYIGCGGMLIKKMVYDHIGLFDNRFNPAMFEDPDYCFSAIQHGYKLGWCYDCPINHLKHQTINNQRLFNKSEQFVRSWKIFQDKWYPYYPDSIQMEVI